MFMGATARGKSAKKNAVTTIGYGVQPFIRKSMIGMFLIPSLEKS